MSHNFQLPKALLLAKTPFFFSHLGQVQTKGTYEETIAYKRRDTL